MPEQARDMRGCLGGVGEMVKQVKTYGKKKVTQLSDVFGGLSVSPKPAREPLPIELLSNLRGPKEDLAAASGGPVTSQRPDTQPENAEEGESEDRKDLPESKIRNQAPLSQKAKGKQRATDDHPQPLDGPLTSHPTDTETENAEESENENGKDQETEIPSVPLSEKAKGKRPERRVNAKQGRPVLDRDHEINALTSLNYVDSEVKDLQECCETWETYFKVSKIAQGSYASILRMEMITSSKLYTVWKLIPIKLKKGKGSRAPNQTSIEDAAAEVKALATMQQFHGFVDFRSAQVLRGSPPPLLSQVHKEWALTHPDDEDQGPYGPDQLWLLIEMTDAGTDLEAVLKHGFPNGSLLNKAKKGARLTIKQTWDIFWAVTEALARGEKWAGFEHRDLHPGNICITDSKTLSKDAGQDEMPRFTNLKVTLIDYTLSRAVTEEGEVLANSMRDSTIFAQTSDDPTDARQYEMYRVMKALVVGPGEGQRDAVAKWKEFVPVTNVIWLFHILTLLLQETERYKQNRRAGKVEKGFTDVTEQKMAHELACVLDHLRPATPTSDEWPYLSATEIVDHKMRRLKTPFVRYLDGDSEAMRQQRFARADMCIPV